MATLAPADRLQLQLFEPDVRLLAAEAASRLMPVNGLGRKRQVADPVLECILVVDWIGQGMSVPGRLGPLVEP